MFKSIREAINLADDGDTLLLYKGKLRESINDNILHIEDAPLTKNDIKKIRSLMSEINKIVDLLYGADND